MGAGRTRVMGGTCRGVMGLKEQAKGKENGGRMEKADKTSDKGPEGEDGYQQRKPTRLKTK